MTNSADSPERKEYVSEGHASPCSQCEQHHGTQCVTKITEVFEAGRFRYSRLRVSEVV